MRRIRVVLTIAVAIVTMVLCFAVPALAYGPHGLIGEGRTDIKEGRNSILQPQRAHHAIQEGKEDIRKGQRGGSGH